MSPISVLCHLLPLLLLQPGCAQPSSGADAKAVQDAGPKRGEGSRCDIPLASVPVDVDALLLVNRAAAVEVRLARKILCSGGTDTIFGFHWISIWRGGDCVVVDEQGEYINGAWHHTAVRVEVDGVRAELELRYDLAARRWNPTLSGFDVATDEQLWGPIALIATWGPLACPDCPSHLPVYLNEFMAGPGTWKDEHGEAAAWIELWNNSGKDVDLSGYALSDDVEDPRKWVFASGTILANHRYLVLAADGRPERGPLHTSFRLDSKGGFLKLSGPDGQGNGGRTYPAQTAGQSTALHLPERRFVATDQPTPGGPNKL